MNFERAYRLRPRPSAGSDRVSQLRIEGGETSQIALLPLSPGLGYLVVPTGGTVRSIASDDFAAERLGLLLSLWARLRLKLLFKKKKFLQFEEFSLFSFGARAERKRFTTFNQHLFNTGVALDGELAASHPELLWGWPPIASPKRAASAPDAGAQACAIVAHVYYEDTWPDIAGALMRVGLPFDLIVTTVPGRERMIDAISHDFPDAEIIVGENRGRDVRPFLALLESGRLDRYRYVCKIHGKKSNDGGRMPYFGALWRRRSLFDLLAGPDIARRITDKFEQDAKVGMIGPHAFRLPSANASLEQSWAETQAQTLELAAKMGVPAEQFRLDFFAGTMFWVRPEALRTLRDLRVASEFAEEGGLLDGGLEHAIERLFGAAVTAAGYKLVDSDGVRVSE